MMQLVRNQMLLMCYIIHEDILKVPQLKIFCKETVDIKLSLHVLKGKNCELFKLWDIFLFDMIEIIGNVSASYVFLLYRSVRKPNTCT